jgi:hypothetical protein
MWYDENIKNGGGMQDNRNSGDDSRWQTFSMGQSQRIGTVS